MLTTEEEAKTKWCPFARVAVDARGASVSVNRHLEGAITQRETRCLTSACMAWRWIDDEWLTEEPNDPTESPPSTRHRRGFCGLAGKP